MKGAGEYFPFTPIFYQIIGNLYICNLFILHFPDNFKLLQINIHFDNILRLDLLYLTLSIIFTSINPCIARPNIKKDTILMPQFWHI